MKASTRAMAARHHFWAVVGQWTLVVAMELYVIYCILDVMFPNKPLS